MISLHSLEALQRMPDEDRGRPIAPIRIHHLNAYTEMCQSRYGWRGTSYRMPWQMDANQRNEIATQAAFQLSKELTTDHVAERNRLKMIAWTSPYYRSWLDYMTDVIGQTDESARTYQLRHFQIIRRFLNSMWSPDIQYRISREVDDICRACIGSGSGVGNHCTEEVSNPNERDQDRVILMNLLTKGVSYLEKSGGGIAIGARSFFDIRFKDLVTDSLSR